tara:strand:- start:5585 stop:5809 length:225 start_codon:yes stop_codon:yes gene_type:complete
MWKAIKEAIAVQVAAPIEALEAMNTVSSTKSINTFIVTTRTQRALMIELLLLRTGLAALLAAQPDGTTTPLQLV